MGTTATALISLSSSVLGGLIGAASAYVVMVKSQREARRLNDRAERREAARLLIEEFHTVQAGAFDEAGRRVEGDEAISLVRSLQARLASAAPALVDCGLEARLGEALELILILDDAVAAHGHDSATASAVLTRFHLDRRGYVQWVVASLQDVASGDPAPAESSAPAPLSDVTAPPWTDATHDGSLTPAQRIRRRFSNLTNQ